jgi:sarcosine oxidase delta subunit
MKLHEAFSPDESKKIYDNFLAIVNDPKRRDRLVRKYGKNAENVAYGTAVNQVKKQAANNIEEPQPEETMENNRLREMVIDALTEKKKSSAFTPEYDDKFTDKRKDLPDGLQKSILKKQGKLNEGVTDEIEDYFELMIQTQPEDALALIMDLVKNDGKNWGEWINNIQADIVDTAGGDYEGDIRGYREELEEDLDLGHTDNEPHMVKAELYKIGKYAMELYKMVDQFEGPQEVDFPGWWQSKITTAKNMISSAKHYLEFELKEPEIDAMVGVASEEGAIDENIDDIDYRNRNNVMRGIYDLAEKSKDVESFKDKWYKTYSRGLQDKDADTDEWLETIFRRVNKSSKSIDEKLKPSMGAGAYVDDFRKSAAPQFKGKSKAKKNKMAVAAYLSAKDKIKEAILAKLKNK